jgi:hypothetical protein
MQRLMKLLNTQQGSRGLWVSLRVGGEVLMKKATHKPSETAAWLLRIHSELHPVTKIHYSG